MASLTLVEAAKIQQNPLIAGIIESIVTVNPMYQILPFDQIVGTIGVADIDDRIAVAVDRHAAPDGLCFIARSH